MTLPSPSVRGPRYGTATLADLTAAIVTQLGVPGTPPGIDVPTPLSDRVILLVLDGLGADLLATHADDAPWLHAHTLDRIDAAFPTTTATSLASIGTGVATGQHGIVGSTMVWDGAPLDCLRWCRGTWPTRFSSALDEAVPEQVQPHPTAFERADRAGVAMRVVSRPEFARSGLTRAGLRGGSYVPVVGLAPTLEAALREATTSPGAAFVYTHHGDIDTTGHLAGPGTPAWREQLVAADHAIAAWARSLPDDVTFLATADHGMIASDPDGWIELEGHDALNDGVESIAGEPRNRYAHVAPGARDDVLATWREVLPADVIVQTRDEAIARGWFGTVAAHVRPRIGDVVATCVGRTNLVHAAQDTLGGRLAGMHGGLTSAELEVPLIAAPAR